MKITPIFEGKEGIIIAVSERLRWMAKFINEIKRFSCLWWNAPSQMQLPHPQSSWNIWTVSNITLTLNLLTWTIWRAPTNASKWRMGFNSAFKGLMYEWFKSLEPRISCRMLSKKMSYGYRNVAGQYLDNISFRICRFIRGKGGGNYIQHKLEQS